MAEVTWVIDSSSLMDIKSKTSIDLRSRLYPRLTILAMEGKLRAPKQVLDEMRRGAQTRHRDEALEWAIEHEVRLTAVETSVGEQQAVMGEVGDVVDHERDTVADDADPYVLALALKLQQQGLAVRIVTEDRRDRLRKVSLTTAAGILGIPCVPLSGFLRAEGIS